MVNAARHSGAPECPCILEVGEHDAVVFVRDRGRGFDPEGVARTDGGIAESIVGRMTRNGGGRTSAPRPGDGTEVELTMPACREVTDA